MNDFAEFEAGRSASIAALGSDERVKQHSLAWINLTAPHRYTYNFDAFGLPIIQLPQDIVAMQELIWKVRPDVVIETGIARGGSLAHSAGLLALLDYCDAATAGAVVDPKKPRRRVVGIDIDIRAHNRSAIEQHPLSAGMTLIEGSSVDPATAELAARHVRSGERVLVILDSNHTHEHVLAELELYAPLVSVGSYCVVMDTLVEDMGDEMFPDRPWGKGDNPKTAVWEYLKSHNEFEIDNAIPDKLLMTVAPDGYLRRIR